jgi:hypothetical protein
MPIVEVLGFSGNDKSIIRLISALQEAVASVKELEVGAKQVTPYIHSAIQARENQVIVVKVVGLFDKKERTNEVLKKLAQTVFVSMREFLLKRNIPTELIEVIVEPRINPDGGEYFAANPQRQLAA